MFSNEMKAILLLPKLFNTNYVIYFRFEEGKNPLFKVWLILTM